MRKQWIAASVIVLFFCGCRKQPVVAPFERNGFLMDTLVRISIWDRLHTPDQIQTAVDRCLGEMSRLEGLTSIHVDTSEISKVVRGAGRDTVAVSPETLEVLRRAIQVSEESDGAFDVTIGALKDLWEFDVPNPKLPEPDAIRRLLKTVDRQQIEISQNRVFLTRPSVRIDLGGIAKGYIVDRGVKVLRDAGLQAGILEAGGDLYAFGKNPNRKFWRIGVKHPRDPQNGLIGILEIGEAAVATSGDYERYFIADGKRYHHILDPKTGYPAAGCVSVTIVAPNTITSDAFATAVFVLGPEKGMALIEKLPEIEGLIMTEKNDRIIQKISSGLKSKYKAL